MGIRYTVFHKKKEIQQFMKMFAFLKIAKFYYRREIGEYNYLKFVKSLLVYNNQ